MQLPVHNVLRTFDLDPRDSAPQACMLDALLGIGLLYKIVGCEVASRYGLRVPQFLHISMPLWFRH